MSGKPGNQSLHVAAAAHKDEFYTQLADIESELTHYREHFQNKVVYCNCDDPTVSNFFKYFSMKFSDLGLKKLITTCYRNQQRDLFSQHDVENAVKLEYDGFREGDRVPQLQDIGVTQLKGDGDFRSEECIELIMQADIVVTNPPFSLFREYIRQLVDYDKKFIVIGPRNAITYKEVFPLLMENRVWLGYHTGDMEFRVPDSYPAKEHRFRKDENGNKFYSLGNAGWFTNLEIAKRNEHLILYKSYQGNENEYPFYDNYDAIEVNQVAIIPKDWGGAMGVPITFLDKYNPDQFEIIGITKTWFGGATKAYPRQVQVSASGKRSEVTKLNDGAALKIDGPVEKTYYLVDGDHYVQKFARILVRNRNVQT